jgi:ribosomal protein S12 methylthiotransferase accessory factor
MKQDLDLPDHKLSYELVLEQTTASSGFFACRPAGDPDIDQALEHLRSRPWDDFMRKHCLARLRQLPVDECRQRVLNRPASDALLGGLLFEACLLFPELRDQLPSFGHKEIESFLPLTSLVYVKSHLLPDQSVHSRWAEIFHANIFAHLPLPPPEATGLPLPFRPGAEPELQVGGNIKDIIRCLGQPKQIDGAGRPSARHTADLALTRLTALGVLAGEEMRHESSLSLYGLLRKWQMSITVQNGRLDYGLAGTQTAYGKGLSLDAARASYAMEIVERYSAYASIAHDRVSGYARDYRLVRASRSGLLAQGQKALDPNTLGLEVPYDNEPLYWIEARTGETDGAEAVMVPAQLVFLFCNLDEISLTSGLASTGLASGNSLAEAKLHALLEVIERDGEAVNPYHACRCFAVNAQEPRLAALFEDYRSRGIQIQFQDISPAFGVPCCKCFVIRQDGSVAKGASAHLDGRQAVLSALTETPYPYPYGPPSAAGPSHLPVLSFEDLPVFSTGTPAQDLALLEATLSANGHHPVYVDLTRSDLDLPVVKALVPGLEILNDFDSLTRINPRLFSNYLKMFPL